MIALFPLRRQTAFVRQVVEELRALPSQKRRDEVMIRHIGQKYERAVTFIEDDLVVEQDLIQFADEVWSQVTGEKRGGAA
ncbi:hypothetical protein [Bradyrhizobium sp. JYMT SZCCT0428]|uniref:hypothetical protein n=1 Tax=Bradyrhizobium sp. JYMT SZCCT0428 TaxID=2807673 RepID=UPI001BA528E3|nr:hypothetical protein [Bradyrhizobium sp. JYMT SZCCT0428]MBR1154598.1 hypothetical protein [Bradyrhizobium sp. JYMT SZCCT0428]